MAKAVDIERARIERLAREMVPTLQTKGSLIRKIADVDDIDCWRKAARRAGRILGWRIRTGVSSEGSTLWAVSDDYEPSPEERWRASQLMTQALRGEQPDG